jgi:VCBS repeat-containing protein
MHTSSLHRGKLPTRKKMLVEALEHRILYSADAGALLLDHSDTNQTAEVRIIETTTPNNVNTPVIETTRQQHEIVFVDTSVEDYQVFVDDILAQQNEYKQMEIVLLNQDEDGVTQISKVLNSYDNVSAIHLVSHGSAGNVQIGNDLLNANALQLRADEIQSWRNALTDDADILLYGCNISATAEGQGFIQTLSQLSGADVAASDDVTGNTSNWLLESATGHIEAASLQSHVWQGTLAITVEGGETLVNQTTLWTQDASEVAADVAGNYVVVWQSNLQDGSGYSIYAQRYNAAGVAQGTEFQVNTTTIWDQQNPAIAMDDNGNFVVTWESNLQDGGGYGIYAQRYDAAGVAQGSEFQVNTTTSWDQQNPAIAMDGNGNFVVAWQSYLQDGSSWGIYAQRYDAAGVAQGAEFQVNSYVNSNQIEPAIAMDANGNFVVAWSSFGQDSSGYGIYAQRYDASGVTQGAEFQVNTYTSATQNISAIAMDANGNFVVTWQSVNQDGSGYGIYAQRYDAAGVAQGAEFQVNTTTTLDQINAAIAMDANGNFVVTWQSEDQDGSGYGIYAQRYDAAGVAQEAEFQVNTTTLWDQSSSHTTWNGGNIIVTWSGNGDQAGNADSAGVFLQRYSVNKAPINTVPGSQTVNEDTLLNITGISVNDVDDNLSTTQLTVSNGILNVVLSGGAIISAGANGSTTLTLSGSQTQINAALATLSYQGNTNFNGSDSLTVTSTDSDGTPLSDTDTVSITVNQINDIGAFSGNISATTNEDTVTAGTVTFADAIDGYSVNNFAINTAATNGTAAIDASGNWTYTPTANYNGSDSFTVQVTDDDGNVETQVISITVTQINDAGSFGGDVSVTTDEDTTTSGIVTFTDAADGFTTPNFSLLSAASNGVAVINAAGNWTYTPSANYNGADSFAIQVVGKPLVF